MQTATFLRTSCAVLALGALAACSSTPPPVDQLAVSRSTVNRVGAEANVVANAPVELQRARDKVAMAEKAMNDKNYDMARRFAAEAEADARVAETKADAANNANTLQQVQTSIRGLQTEIDRRAPVVAPVPPAPGAMAAPRAMPAQAAPMAPPAPSAPPAPMAAPMTPAAPMAPVR